jgi:hypothetical protein
MSEKRRKTTIGGLFCAPVARVMAQAFQEQQRLRDEVTIRDKVIADQQNEIALLHTRLAAMKATLDL